MRSKAVGAPQCVGPIRTMYFLKKGYEFALLPPKNVRYLTKYLFLPVNLCLPILQDKVQINENLGESKVNKFKIYYVIFITQFMLAI